jgi:hypothetical protein
MEILTLSLLLSLIPLSVVPQAQQRGIGLRPAGAERRVAIVIGSTKISIPVVEASRDIGFSGSFFIFSD